MNKHTSSSEVPKRHAEYHQSEQILKHLLRGADTEDDPLKEVITSLEFAAAKTADTHRPRGYRYDKSLSKSDKFCTAIAQLKEYDNDERWKQGLNAMTLLTEYRRKIIFQAMLDTKDVAEDRALAREKLDAYLTLHAPELLDTEVEGTDNPSGSGPPALKAECVPPQKEGPNSSNRADRHFRTAKRDSVEVLLEQSRRRQQQLDSNFGPKWVEYDTMRNRWKYIKPQIRDFARDEDMIVPRSPERLVRVRDSQIRGTCAEAIQYRNRAPTSSSDSKAIRK